MAGSNLCLPVCDAPVLHTSPPSSPPVVPNSSLSASTEKMFSTLFKKGLAVVTEVSGIGGEGGEGF